MRKRRGFPLCTQLSWRRCGRRPRHRLESRGRPHVVVGVGAKSSALALSLSLCLSCPSLLPQGTGWAPHTFWGFGQDVRTPSFLSYGDSCKAFKAPSAEVFKRPPNPSSRCLHAVRLHEQPFDDLTLQHRPRPECKLPWLCLGKGSRGLDLPNQRLRLLQLLPERVHDGPDASFYCCTHTFPH